MIWGGYNAGTPLWYGLTWFAVSVAGTTVILGWLRFASDSVWPCALYHAAHNTLVQSVFDAASDGPRARWILGEFGFGLAIAITVVAALVWRRGVAAAAPRADRPQSPCRISSPESLRQRPPSTGQKIPCTLSGIRDERGSISWWSGRLK